MVVGDSNIPIVSRLNSIHDEIFVCHQLGDIALFISELFSLNLLIALRNIVIVDSFLPVGRTVDIFAKDELVVSYFSNVVIVHLFEFLVVQFLQDLFVYSEICLICVV